MVTLAPVLNANPFTHLKSSAVLGSSCPCIHHIYIYISIITPSYTYIYILMWLWAPSNLPWSRSYINHQCIYRWVSNVLTISRHVGKYHNESSKFSNPGWHGTKAPTVTFKVSSTIKDPWNGQMYHTSWGNLQFLGKFGDRDLLLPRIKCRNSKKTCQMMPNDAKCITMYPNVSIQKLWAKFEHDSPSVLRALVNLPSGHQTFQWKIRCVEMIFVHETVHV